MEFLVLPGIGNSDKDHWQTQWEQSNPYFKRVMQDSWTHPTRDAWVAKLESAIAESTQDIVLVAHSLGCLLAAHWAQHSSLRIKGALLVAPPDPHSKAFPTEAAGFADLPDHSLDFKSIVIASSNDPYASIEFSTHYAKQWGSELICIGDHGHINGNSHLGKWQKGQAILQRLVAAIDH